MTSSGHWFASASSTYQWAIIDCPPSVGLITFNALKACDEVVVPVETGYFSLHGLTVDQIIVNRVLPDEIIDPFFEGWRKAQRGVLQQIEAYFAPVTVSTVPLFQRFLKQASLYGLKLTEMGEFTTYLLGISAGEEQVNPRLSVPQTEGQ